MAKAKRKRAQKRVGVAQARRFAIDVVEAAGDDAKAFAALAEIVRLMADRSRARRR